MAVVELTREQAAVLLHDLLKALGAVTFAIEQLDRLAVRTPAMEPPTGMFDALHACWETLHSQFNTVYDDLHGNEPTKCDTPHNAAPAEGMGTPAGDV